LQNYCVFNSEPLVPSTLNTFNTTVLNKIEYFHFTFHYVYVYVQIWLGDPWHNDMHGPLLTQEWHMRMQAMEN